MKYHLSLTVIYVDKRVHIKVDCPKNKFNNTKFTVADKNVLFITDNPDPKPMVNVCMNAVSFIVGSGSTYHKLLI